jgi:hypothetical protein
MHPPPPPPPHPSFSCKRATSLVILELICSDHRTFIEEKMVQSRWEGGWRRGGERNGEGGNSQVFLMGHGIHFPSNVIKSLTQTMIAAGNGEENRGGRMGRQGMRDSK